MSDSQHIQVSDSAAQIMDLSLHFPRQNQPLFDALSLSIARGEHVLLLGPSGSGKSTLLKVLAGLIPDTIELPVNWQDRRCFDSWGYVFQDPDAQFCMPYVDEELAFVLENMGTPREEMSALIDDYLQLVGLIFNNVHRPINTLSQGQKQRLALASALALEPDTLILDEPTALLDPRGTHAVWQKVQELAADKTLLIVEHKIAEVTKFVDRVVVLDEGGEMIVDDAITNLPKYRKLLDNYGIWHSQSWAAFDRKQESLLLGGKPAESGEPLVMINQLSGYYKEDERIEISNKQVHAGEWIAITGSNGAGKSTLLLALMQLIETHGQYFLNGKKVQRTEQVASEIGFVFQNPELQFVEQTVYKELAFTLQTLSPELDEDEVAERVEPMLEMFQLATVAEQNPYQLSTGQQRRLSVASVIIKERSVLLLDEPTFGQDAVNTFVILNQLEKLRKQGTAILMVTHDRQIVDRFATREWQISEGRLLADQRGNRLSKANPEDSAHAI